ncbi:MAG: DedA family protein [Actinomycetota bacterium]|nr:DedA family protein [Actinomycetota bacterium]
MTHLVVTYGYVAVFVLVAAESVGIPLPGETTLIVAAAYAGRTHGLSVWGIFAVAATATVVGDNIGYWIGAKGGLQLIRRWGPRLHLDEARIKVGWYIFARHGAKIVFFGRYISVFRTYAAFLAGANRMPWRRFLAYNLAGGVTWAAVYTFLAYNAAQLLARASTTLTIAAIAAMAGAMIATIVAVRRGAARLTDRAEAAFPGSVDQAERQEDLDRSR